MSKTKWSKNVVLTERKIPEFEIDLETSPEKRWIPIVKHFEKYLPALKKVLVEEEKDAFGTTAFAKFAKGVSKIIDVCKVPKELEEELDGICSISEKHGLTYEDLVSLNCGYSYLGGCTSCVKDGYHFRNMDWEMEELRDLTMNVTFKRDGKKLYKITSWCCFVGVLTGMRYGGWSISLNFRKIPKKNPSFFWNSVSNVFSGLFGYWPIEFLIRTLLEQEADFEGAEKLLTSEYIMAPCFLVLCGKKQKEQLLIVRKRTKVDKSIVSQDFICQTNNDPGMKELREKWCDDDLLLESSLDRRKTAVQMLDKIQEKTIVKGGLNLLKEHPVRNEFTCYSVIMSPRNNHYSSYQLKKEIGLKKTKKSSTEKEKKDSIENKDDEQKNQEIATKETTKKPMKNEKMDAFEKMDENKQRKEGDKQKEDHDQENDVVIEIVESLPQKQE